jgi:hypothetical protein
MTRKRSKYRPKGIIRDTMGYVKAGIATFTSHPDANVVLRIRNNDALKALAEGKAGPVELDVLIGVSNIATALKRLGTGKDWSAEIRAGTDAVEAIQIRFKRWQKIQATPAEIAAVTLMVDIHEAQLDASSVVDVEKAITIAQRGVALVAA